MHFPKYLSRGIFYSKVILVFSETSWIKTTPTLSCKYKIRFLKNVSSIRYDFLKLYKNMFLFAFIYLGSLI